MSAVVMFSGGIASFFAAQRAIDRFGRDRTALLFTDTRTEDEDLYRFLDDAERHLGVPVTRIADGRDIWQTFRDERMLGNSRIDPCSRILKRELSRRWVRENADPDAVIVLGLDWTEMHRVERAAAAWQPWTVWCPMAEAPYRLRADMFADLEATGIALPRLYRMGFSHNNCGGGCVKAGVGHFALLLRAFPERYAEWEAGEESVRSSLGKDVSILRTMTLAELRQKVADGPAESLDLWDYGGCGCFEEPVA